METWVICLIVITVVVLLAYLLYVVYDNMQKKSQDEAMQRQEQQERFQSVHLNGQPEIDDHYQHPQNYQNYQNQTNGQNAAQQGGAAHLPHPTHPSHSTHFTHPTHLPQGVPTQLPQGVPAVNTFQHPQQYNQQMSRINPEAAALANTQPNPYLESDQVPPPAPAYATATTVPVSASAHNNAPNMVNLQSSSEHIPSLPDAPEETAKNTFMSPQQARFVHEAAPNLDFLASGQLPAEFGPLQNMLNMFMTQGPQAFGQVPPAPQQSQHSQTQYAQVEQLDDELINDSDESVASAASGHKVEELDAEEKAEQSVAA